MKKILAIMCMAFLPTCFAFISCSKDNDNANEPVNVLFSSEIQGSWKEKFEGQITYMFNGDNYEYELKMGDSNLRLKEHGTFKVSNGSIVFSILQEMGGLTIPGKEYSAAIQWKNDQKELLMIDGLLFTK